MGGEPAEGQVATARVKLAAAMQRMRWLQFRDEMVGRLLVDADDLLADVQEYVSWGEPPSEADFREGLLALRDMVDDVHRGLLTFSELREWVHELDLDL